MAELEIVNRRSMTWMWWLLGILIVVGLMWLGNAYLESPELADDPIEFAPEAAAGMVPTGVRSSPGEEMKHLPVR